MHWPGQHALARRFTVSKSRLFSSTSFKMFLSSIRCADSSCDQRRTDVGFRYTHPFRFFPKGAKPHPNLRRSREHSNCDEYSYRVSEARECRRKLVPNTPGRKKLSSRSLSFWSSRRSASEPRVRLQTAARTAIQHPAAPFKLRVRLRWAAAPDHPPVEKDPPPPSPPTSPLQVYSHGAGAGPHAAAAVRTVLGPRRGAAEPGSDTGPGAPGRIPRRRGR